jgi:hypothetical protein
MVAVHRIIPFAVAVLVAATCGTVAAFSLTAALTAVPAGQVIDELRNGREVTPPQIRQAVDVSVRAGRIFERGRYFSDAAMAAGRLAPGVRAQALGRMPMRTLIEDALVAAPVSPQNWARRAALQLSVRDYQGARSSLEMSILLGRYVPGLTVPRLRIILELIKHRSDAEMDRYFTEQAIIAARTEAPELAAFADKGAAEGRTQRALYTDFTAYSAYMTHLVGRRAAAKAAQPQPKPLPKRAP